MELAFLKTFVTLLAVVEPFGVIPFFIPLVAELTRKQENYLSFVVGVALFITLSVFALFGAIILGALGISLASFEIGGGIILIWMAINMLKAMPKAMNASDGEAQEFHAIGDSKEISNKNLISMAIVPIAIPLLAGPGAISAVIIQGGLLSFAGKFAFLGTILAVAIVTYVVLRSAKWLSKILGVVGINIISRVSGLILVAIGVEIIVKGIKISFGL